MPFSIRPFRRLMLTYVWGFRVVITLLLLSSGPAYAEWQLLYNHEGRGEAMYVDTDTIRHKGDVVKWWELYDYKTIQTDAGSSYFSSKVQREYDCAAERNRSLAFSLFSGHMGSGNVVHSQSNEGKWAPVEPGSVGIALWKAACNKQ